MKRHAIAATASGALGTVSRFCASYINYPVGKSISHALVLLFGYAYLFFFLKMLKISLVNQPTVKNGPRRIPNQHDPKSVALQITD